ncbi:MAG: TolC family protein [Deltaproteobacteria bacterium]|nr:TolC family protein [Deltaproteobacteria bacterium]
MVLLVFLVALSGDPGALRAQDKPLLRVGTLVDGPGPGVEEFRGEFEREIEVLLSGEYQVVFPEDARLDGDWTLAKARENVERLLDAPNVDAVVAVGVLSSFAAATHGSYSKPVIAPHVLDAPLQGIPLSGDTSGVKNLNYLYAPAYVEQNLRRFKEIIPYRKVAFLMPRFLIDEYGAIETRVREDAAKAGADVQLVPVGNSPEEALVSIASDVDAVYVAPMIHMPPTDYDKLIQGLIARKLPSFAFFGETDVRRGVLAGTLPATHQTRITRRVALNLQRILLGEDAGTLSVSVPAEEKLYLNMATAQRIGLAPPLDVVASAIIVQEAGTSETKRLTLKQAVATALESNLDLAAQRQSTQSGRYDVNQAWANVLPSAEVNATGRIIDEDRAEASNGNAAEQELRVGAEATQVLVSEEAWANISVQKKLQRGREDEEESTRLDTVQETVDAYLNLLRARTLERIEKDNLQTTRKHLELAQLRERLGVSSSSEVYRWEIEIANAKQSVLSAVALRRNAERQVNRLLDRPLDEPIVTEDLGLDSPQFFLSDERIAQLLRNSRDIEIFTEFAVRDGLDNSPEMRRIDEAEAAQKRLLTSKRLQYVAPTLALQAQVEQIVDRAGAGDEYPQVDDTVTIDTPAGSQTIDNPVAGIFGDNPDDTEWSVGLQASLPILEGGRRYAEHKQTAADLERVRLERRSVRAKLEQRIRSALSNIESSHPSVELAKQAAEAARKNLELVSDAYRRGVVSIIDLIDAQNAALVANEGAVNAEYDCLVDYMEYQRSVGRFDILMDDEEKGAWIGRLLAFFEEYDAVPAESR